MNKINKRIILLIGNMGSGKSEIGFNYALQYQSLFHRPVKLIDMDIIKPYIRLRDVLDKAKAMNIDLLVPETRMLKADMPIVPAKMIAYLQDDSYDLIMDVGGEDRGSVTIAQFQDFFKQTDLSVWLVVNPFRPFADSPEKIVQIISTLQISTKLLITGLVANPHLRFDTTLENVKKGISVVQEASSLSHLPITLIGIWHTLYTAALDKEYSPIPVLPLKLFLTFPWEAGKLTGI